MARRGPDNAPKVGDAAPVFTLKSLDGKSETDLASFKGKKPVLLFEHTRQLTLVVDEPERTEDELIRAAHELKTSYDQSRERVLPEPKRLFGDPLEIRTRLRDAALFLQELSGDGKRLRPASSSSTASR